MADTLLANGVPPIALGWYDFIGAAWWFDYLDLRLNGPEFHAELVQGQVRYDDPRVKEVFETWKSLLDSGYFMAEGASRSSWESLGLVVDGKAGMILCDSAEVGGLSAELEGKLDFFPFPVVDPEVANGEVSRAFGYAIPASARHAWEAMEFSTYLLSVEGQATAVRHPAWNRGLLPVQRGIDVANLAPGTAQGLALAREADHIGLQYITSGMGETGQLGYAAYRAFARFLNDTWNLESALSTLEEERQRAFGQ